MADGRDAAAALRRRRKAYLRDLKGALALLAGLLVAGGVAITDMTVLGLGLACALVSAVWWAGTAGRATDGPAEGEDRC